MLCETPKQLYVAFGKTKCYDDNPTTNNPIQFGNFIQRNREI